MKLVKNLIPYIIIFVIVVIIRTYIITPVKVVGSSMVPTLEDKELLLLKKYDHKYERFEIVVFNYGASKLVKRVIGLPGEHVKYENNKLYINNELIEEDFISVKTTDFDLKQIGYDIIPEGYYFVVGDNRNNSKDSRMIGLISADDILGSTSFSFFPFNKFGVIK